MKKLYTILVVMFPILSVYATPIPKLSAADMAMVLLLPIFIVGFLIKKNKIKSKVIPVTVFIFYILLTLLMQIALKENVSVLSTIRYVLYLIFLLLAFEYFIFQYGVKVLKIVTLSVSIYVIIQYLTYSLFSFTLPWCIEGLKVMDESFILMKQSEYYMTFYRPTGIFMEPTHFAQYCVVYLVYLLLYDVKQKLQLFNALLVTAAVIASGSSLGFIFLIIVWGIYYAKKQKYRFTPLKLTAAIFIIFIIASIIFRIDYFQQIVLRVVTDNGFNGEAVGYRFNSISIFQNQDIPIFNRVFGFGRSSSEVYLTGIFYFLYSNGIIGLLLYIWICIDAAIRSKDFGRWLVVIAFILSIGSEFICNFGILFYFSFVYALNKGQILSQQIELVRYRTNDIVCN
ncbi:MAG: hypothetical protein ACM3KR_08130 [Deltaproteobacteria bacterium]